MDRVKWLVIYAHANGCDLGGISDEMYFLSGELGVYFLALEYRGYGLSLGKSCEKALNNDIATVAYATEVLKVPSNRIILWGCSLGTGLCTNLAANLGMKGVSLGGLILQAPYRSIMAVVQDVAKVIPESVATEAWSSWRSEERIKNVTCQILLLHGEKDEMINISHSQAL
eukprot:jgi/Bigna1/41461/e_gw1.52.68.1